jgi:hypothetical protein
MISDNLGLLKVTLRYIKNYRCPPLALAMKFIFCSTIHTEVGTSDRISIAIGIRKIIEITDFTSDFTYGTSNIGLPIVR